MFLLTAFAAAIAAGAVQAKGRADATPPPVAATTAPASPRANSNLPESVRRVERQTGGEVLRAEPMQQDGHEVYRLKVLTQDGRVRVMQDDPTQPANQPPASAPQKRKPVANDAKADKDGG
jgi:hypothetical protein